MFHNVCTAFRRHRGASARGTQPKSSQPRHNHCDALFLIVSCVSLFQLFIHYTYFAQMTFRSFSLEVNAITVTQLHSLEICVPNVTAYSTHSSMLRNCMPCFSKIERVDDICIFFLSFSHSTALYC